ncbi:hypothetical protein NFI96_024536, partial [Prochilodus magdalenae]
VSEGQFGEDLQLSANSDQLQLHKHHAPHVCTAAADGRMCPLSEVNQYLSATKELHYGVQDCSVLHSYTDINTRYGRPVHTRSCGTELYYILGCSELFCVSLVDIISAEIRLDQSPAEVKKPGEAVKISCTISGYSMTSYNMHWIRQKPGNALEWMGRMDTGSNSATYADSMRDHFVMTEDVSTSTQFLQAKSLRAEDTAVYYCARYPTVMELMEQLY